MKKIILAFSFVALMAAALSVPLKAGAQDSIIDPAASAYKTGSYSLNDIMEVAIGASRWVLGIVGSLALIMFIYGGVMFLISAGSSDKIGKAKNIIVAAVIGLIIVFSSYIIIKFVLSSLGLDWNGEAKQMTVISQ